MCGNAHGNTSLELTLFEHPLIRELRRTEILNLQEIDAEPGSSDASVSYVIENERELLRVVVDHSYFTAKRTAFAVTGPEPVKTAAVIVEAVQAAVIGLQSKTFQMLATVNGAVINSLDETEIVDNVLREVMHVLPHCDAGVFRLFEEDSGFLVPVSYAGLPEDYGQYRVEPNESVSGEVFSSGLPAIHNGRQNIIDAHRVMRPESQSFMERSQIANALLCVPVIGEGKCLGTLTTLCFSSQGAFSTFDRMVLEFMAAQIAIAYQRSVAYKNAVATSDRLEQVRNNLALKNSELDRALELHEALLRIFSVGGSLSELLQSVGELFVVEFRFENVLGLDYRTAKWSMEEASLFQTVEVADAPVGQFQFPTSGDMAFCRVLFGTLATFVALDFVRDMSRMDLLNAGKKAYFDALILGSEADVPHSHHGFRPGRHSQVMVVKELNRQISANMHLTLHKSESDLLKGMTVTNALIFHQDDQIVVVVSSSTAAALDRNLIAISELAADLGICVGASDIYEGSEAHQQARDSAAHAAGALLRRGRPGLLRQRDMGVELLFEGRARQDIIVFTREVLMPLLREPKNGPLYETLSRYVSEGKSASRTAQALGIHANTLYQRLQKIEALTGRKLADAADFTLLSLACQLHADYSETP